MQFGLVTFVTAESIRPDELAGAAEERGFDSLFVCEHSQIPASRLSPWPGGAELPDEYYRTYDPFVALSIAATATTRLRLGTGVCLVTQRDPIHTAKSVASLDQLSGGRFLFGVGAGWNREEMEQHGTNPKTRMRLMRERILAMRELWTSEVAEFHGEFVDIEPTYMRPKPLQAPYPPIIVGGLGPTVLDRVLEYGDGWAPNPGWPPHDGLEQEIVELRRRAEELGRSRPSVLVFGVSDDTDQMSRYAEMGVDACVLMLPTRSRDDTLRDLDRLAGAVPARA